ncbi:hypothetical protein HOL34_00045 [bacterium]|nr:hypothetical protein [bacterium]MBT3903467.1 hypothetical protein [bacterium]MBT4577981.1 hypothetical protein [bacterium]MBT5345987.1 hypothetical protein [bacterium]MBT6130773.1 hypothetical protein [bacterium]
MKKLLLSLFFALTAFGPIVATPPAIQGVTPQNSSARTVLKHFAQLETTTPNGDTGAQQQEVVEEKKELPPFKQRLWMRLRFSPIAVTDVLGPVLLKSTLAAIAIRVLPAVVVENMLSLNNKTFGSLLIKEAKDAIAPIFITNAIDFHCRKSSFWAAGISPESELGKTNSVWRPISKFASGVTVKGCLLGGDINVTGRALTAVSQIVTRKALAYLYNIS